MIRILHPGIHISVQDKGRTSFGHLGVPVSGYMDAYSVELGNTLLRNRPWTPVLEITFGMGKLEFLTSTYICLTGGDFSPKIDDADVEMNAVLKVEKGSILSFKRRRFGARVYLAVRDGIQSEAVLMSQSFLSGITKAKLEKNDTLAIKTKLGFDSKGFAKVKVNQEHFTSEELECFPGPEFDLLTENQQQRLFEAFTISEDNNRVGYRLNEVIDNNLPSILTSAVLPGTVQLTPSGKLIVLMKDCQVTGGYPRVLQLSDYAVSRLSQRVTGEELQFCFKY